MGVCRVCCMHICETLCCRSQRKMFGVLDAIFFFIPLREVSHWFPVRLSDQEASLMLLPVSPVRTQEEVRVAGGHSYACTPCLGSSDCFMKFGTLVFA